MPIYKLTLLERHEIARDTIVFTFNKPDGFQFIPGQYGGFTLMNPPETDAGGITRRFSLLNAPSDNHIAFATRIQNSAYKRVLNTFSTGSEIKFAGPTGSFILHEDVNTLAVLIAGGIGVTPFYSMIKHATEQHSAQKIILFYGNNVLQDTALLTELQELQQQNSNFQLIATMANPSQEWTGETGFITHTMLKKYISDINAPMYYICGSPAMVTTLQETIAEMGVDEARIKVEDFPGY
jgi:ferredoxin-NADP reductase